MIAKRQLRQAGIWLLEAIGKNPGAPRWQLEDISGVEGPSFYYRANPLQQFGLVANVTGHYWLTERGRIVLALAEGKQARQRYKRAEHARRILAERNLQEANP